MSYYNEPRGPAQRGAYRKGILARAQGHKLSTCPYSDVFNRQGPTFSRGMLNAWEEGWRDEDRRLAGGQPAASQKETP